MLLLIFLLGLLYGPVLGYYGLQIDSQDKSRLWPKNQDGFKSVGYCFDKEASQNDLADVMSKGWAVWYAKLLAPGPDSSHALDFFRRFQSGGEWPYCQLPDGRWNPAFPGDTLVVKKIDENGSSATVGYYKDGQDGRHSLELELSPNAFEHIHLSPTNSATSLASGTNTLARIGLTTFNTTVSIWQAMTPLLPQPSATGTPRTTCAFCNNHAVAEHYGFAGTEYMGGDEPGGYYSSVYDTASIMHYWSRVFANEDLIDDDPNNPDAYPLVILLGGRKYLIPAPTPQFAVSDLDVVALKRMYPWQRQSASGNAVEQATTMMTVGRAAVTTGGM